LSKHIGKKRITFLRLKEMPMDFKKMLEHVLDKKPDKTLEDLKELIEEKKRRIGAGYLTDQGSLFLVAADLGISFESIPKTETGIKDLYVGARDVNVIVRVLSIYPLRTYAKKDSAEQVENRTMTVYDQDSTIRLKLWNKVAHIPDELQLKSGDMIRVTGGYIKSGLDGKPIINLGESSNIEQYNGSEVSIPHLESISINVDQVAAEQDHIVISGILRSSPRIIEFSDPRGVIKKSLQATLSNSDSSRNLRVAIWNVNENNIPRVLKLNSQVRIIGARIKQGNMQYGNGDFEIHGDEGTVLESTTKQEDYESATIRILSSGRADSSGRINYFSIDKNKNLYSVAIDEKLNPPSISVDSVIEGVPSRIFGNSLIFSQDDSEIKLVEGNSIPKLEESTTKIKDMDTIGEIYVLEAIVLQQPNSTEVNTRTGDLVSVADTLIGDDTGEIRLVGWRENSSHVANLKVGERVRVIGAALSAGRDGRSEITLRKDSVINKIS
jgi:ssDNA-binding replication factor A large subunit